MTNWNYQDVGSATAINKLFCAPNGGSFKWKVRAWVGNSYADSGERAFAIVDSSNLLSFTLSNPSDLSEYTTAENITFNWSDASADYYYLMFRPSNSQTWVYNKVYGTTSTLSSQNIGGVGTYYWTVRAVKGSTYSQSNQRTLYIKAAAPASLTISSPSDGDTFTTAQNVPVTWSTSPYCSTYYLYYYLY